GPVPLDKMSPSERAVVFQSVLNNALRPTSTSRIDTTALTSVTLANTIGATYKLGSELWVEPTASFRYVYSAYGEGASALGLADGQVLRLETGGKLIHQKVTPEGHVWSNSLGAYVYSDVWVEGLVISPLGSSAETTEGKVRVRGVLQTRYQTSDGKSVYAEV